MAQICSKPLGTQNGRFFEHSMGLKMKLLLTLLIRSMAIPMDITVKNSCGTQHASHTGPVLYDFGVQKPCNPKDCGPQIANSLNHPGDRGNVWLWLGAGTYDPFANNNFGAATMVELTLNDATSKQLSVDISRVAGFNVGVAVYGNEKDPWKIVCKDVNCRDAYFLCDARPGDATYSNPCFSPVLYVDGSKPFTIEFCPPSKMENTKQFQSVNHCADGEHDGNPRWQDPKYTYAICDWNAWWNFTAHPESLCFGGSVSNSKCVGAKESPVVKCGAPEKQCATTTTTTKSELLYP